MNNLLIATQIKLNDLDKAFEGASNLRFENMVSGFVKLLLVIAGLAFFFILLIGGIKWIVSGGDKAHTEGARNQITAALVGLVIVFSAWAIIQLISTFLGVNLLNLVIPEIKR